MGRDRNALQLGQDSLGSGWDQFSHDAGQNLQILRLQP